MSALIGNPLLLTSAPADDDAYQIEKSLRFNKPDTPSLQQTVGNAGNRRTFTLSAWVKLAAHEHNIIFGQWDNTYDGTRLHVDTSGTVRFQSIESNGTAFGCNLHSTRKLRDFSAWYHLCVTVDTTLAVTADRVKIYVNGKRLTSFSTGSYPSKDYQFDWNGTTYTRSIGYWKENNTEYSSAALITEAQHIDGLALSPAAFGSFDSTGVWNPKALSLPAPNDGRTWSSSVTTNDSAGFTSGNGVAEMFDGTEDDGYPVNADKTITMTFNPAIEVKQGIRLQLRNGGRTHASWGSTITGTGIKQTHIKDDDCYELWPVDVDYGTKLANLTITPDSGDWAQCARLEIDGVILVDGQTDPTTRNNLNDGRVWSDTGFSVTGGSYYDSNRGPAAMFDGDPVTETLAPDGQTITWKPGLTGTKIEVLIKINTGNGTGSVFTNNGTSVKAAALAQLGSGNQGWYNVGSSIDSSSGMTWSRVGSQDDAEISAVRVDGHVLLDSSVDNSFHLKFNDTTTNAALGYDSLGTTDYSAADSTADKGEPILKTNIAGDTIVAGYRSDSNAASLKLAIPGNVCATGTAGTDQSDHVTNSSSSEKNFSFASTPAVTDSGKYYGKSIKFDGTDDALFVSDHADWVLGTDNFCIEGWFYVDSSSSGVTANDWAPLIFRGHSTNNNIFDWRIYWGTDSGKRKLYADVEHSDGTQFYLADATAEDQFDFDTWNHFAFTRHGSTFRLFLNGTRLIDKETGVSAAVDDDWNDLIMGREKIANNQRYFRGQLNDIRYYKGTSKYGDSDTGFIIPHRNDFTVNNLTESAETTAITWTTACTITGEGSFGSDYEPADGGLFDGSTGTGTSQYIAVGDGPSNRWMKCIFPSNHNGKDVRPIPYSTLKVYSSWRNTQAIQVIYDGVETGVSVSGNTAGANNWHTLSGWTAGKPIDGIRMGVENGNALDWHAIEVDGHILVDGGPIGAAQSKIQSDVLTDSPTLYGTDGQAGGEVRGNFCTLNPLDNGGLTLSQGNLAWTDQSAAGWDSCRGTMFFSTGKWYWEMTMGNWNGSGAPFLIGVADDGMAVTGTELGQNNNSWGFLPTGQKRHNSSTSSHGNAFATSNVIQIALDLSGGLGYGKLWVGINGTWQNSGNPATGANAAWTDIGDNGAVAPAVANAGGNTSGAYHMNFGQLAYKYTAPSGFKSLCTQNLDNTFDSETSENNPSSYFNVLTYTGNEGTQSIKGLSFQPDLLWLKNRDYATDHQIYDAVRGTGTHGLKRLRTNTTGAEADGDGSNTVNFLSDGFSLNGGGGDTNDGGGPSNYVALNWDAGTAANGSTNTDGDNITVAVGKQWVNATAGFSITEYAGDGSGAANNDSGDAVGHGLNAKPDFIIIKKIDGVNGWPCWHNVLSDAEHISLNSSNAKESSNHCYTTEPTNTKVDLGNNPEVNGTGNDYIMYCWTAIAGHSSFGKYIGNGSSDGPFVYTGFRPKFILQKRIDAAGNWAMRDTERAPDGQPVYHTLIGESSEAESNNQSWSYDFLSNGFKVRTNQDNQNENNGQFLYCAWAEHPFKTARAR